MTTRADSMIAMLTLTPHEARVLAVLVEKAQTTPQQYPMTINGLVTGCNQKNNRDPVTNLTEDDVIDALDSLRGKELARQVDMAGSRVPKFRHVAREALQVDTNQLIILAELFMRGPQTIGELRSRAARMLPQGQFESIDIVQNILDSLMARPEPFVRRIARAAGEKAERFAQLLCPDLHPLNAPAQNDGSALPAPDAHRAIHSSSADRPMIASLETRLATVESLLAALQRDVAQMKAVLAAIPAR